MENIVKNLHKVKHLLTDDDLNKLEYGAMLYRRYSRIFFKVISVDAEQKELVVMAWQEKNPTQEYLENKELNERTKELFSKFFEGWVVYTRLYPYQDAPPEIVTPNWIQKQMFENKISNKQLSADLGVARAEISALVNGHREMGIRTKAMFFYYFKSVELQK